MILVTKCSILMFVAFLSWFSVLWALNIRDLTRKAWLLGGVLALCNLIARLTLPQMFGPVIMLTFFLLSSAFIWKVYSVKFYQALIGSAFVLLLTMMGSVLFAQLFLILMKISINEIKSIEWWKFGMLALMESVPTMVYMLLGAKVNVSIVRIRV